MKQAEALKIGDQVWVRKRKGYRIRCDSYEDGAYQQVFMPSEAETPMESDVAAWRLAHKLASATVDGDEPKHRYRQITVVDDLGEQVDYYVTNKPHVLN